MPKKNPVLSAACDPAKVHPALQDNLSYCLYKSAMRLRLMIDKELEKFGIVAPQSGMLKILKISGRLNQNQLGFEMGIDKASMVRFIDGLEEKKFLVRISDTKDRRVKYLEITTRGRELINKLVRIREKLEDEFFKYLSSSEREALKTIIPKLLRH